MCRYSINDFIKNEDELTYGEDYIAIGALEGIFYKDKILKSSNIFKLKFTNSLSTKLSPKIYNKLSKDLN